MKNFNFDEIIDRRNTDAIKVERCKTLFGTENVIPMWVADMDFRTPEFIYDAIRKRLEHPVLGYTAQPENLIPLFKKWISDHHNLEIDTKWAGFIPGIVPALAFAVQSLTKKGDEVIVQPPVYYPFFNVIKNNERVIVNNPLKESEGKFIFDIMDLESKITSRTKMFILCNPHNPGGRVWTKTELSEIATVCERHSLIVVSDEIHADMVLPGCTPHTPFAAVSEWASNNTVTFMAPSKVFNIPGLISSSYIIKNEKLRHKFVSFLEASEMNAGNIFSYVATLACYEHGEQWRREMLEYVKNNIIFVDNYLKQNVRQIKAMIPEASFLMWLDGSETGMNTEELFRFFVDKAQLGLSKGTIFGPGGENHLRLNVACPRAVLKDAMHRLEKAFESLQKI